MCIKYNIREGTFSLIVSSMSKLGRFREIQKHKLFPTLINRVVELVVKNLNLMFSSLLDPIHHAFAHEPERNCTFGR